MESKMKHSSIGIIIPCYNENSTVISFLNSLVNTIKSLDFQFRIFVVNDCSLDETLSLLKNFRLYENNISLHIVDLHYNVGHQKAIMQGLLYAHSTDITHCIVMDGDGEDSPSAIPHLLKHLDKDYVPVIRKKRKERLLFLIGYQCYKSFFKIFVGSDMNFGNYCMFNRKMLENICDNGFVHLAGFLSKQRCTKSAIEWDREKRIDGNSKMNLSGLIHHGFRSFVEYSEEFLLFFLKVFLVTTIGLAALIVNVLYKKLITHDAITGWASTLTVSLFSASMICFGFFILGIFLINMLQKTNSNRPRKMYNILDYNS